MSEQRKTKIHEMKHMNVVNVNGAAPSPRPNKLYSREANDLIAGQEFRLMVIQSANGLTEKDSIK